MQNTHNMVMFYIITPVYIQHTESCITLIRMTILGVEKTNYNNPNISKIKISFTFFINNKYLDKANINLYGILIQYSCFINEPKMLNRYNMKILTSKIYNQKAS